jgi:hypothetical protein
MLSLFYFLALQFDFTTLFFSRGFWCYSVYWGKQHYTFSSKHSLLPAWLYCGAISRLFDQILPHLSKTNKSPSQPIDKLCRLISLFDIEPGCYLFKSRLATKSGFYLPLLKINIHIYIYIYIFFFFLIVIPGLQVEKV